MDSSSESRYHAGVKNSRSFRTCIYPDQREIQICPVFRNAWIQYLREDFFGRLLYQDNKPISVALFLYNNCCYMTDGRIVCNYLGFQWPTNVILTYEIVDNRFSVTVVSDELIDNVPPSDEGDVDNVVRSLEKSYQAPLLVDGESDDDDLEFAPTNRVCHANGCGLPRFKNDRVFSWELYISKSYARSTNDQVLYIPQNAFKRVLLNRKSIMIRTQHSGDGAKWDLIIYKRKTGGQEMYVSKGWFRFLHANCLKEGDKVRFQICDPPDVMVIDIVRLQAA